MKSETNPFRSSSCWSLHLALNEEFIGSIPISGTVARSGVGFQRLTVNEFVAGSIPVGHLCMNMNGGKFLWEGSLIVYQVAAGSTPVAIALKQAAFDYWLGQLSF